LHNTFGFDGEYESKLDFSKTTDQKVAELIALQLLLIDEVSMLDVDIRASVFSQLSNLLSVIQAFSVVWASGLVIGRMCAWDAMTKILGLADHARHRGFRTESDEYGSCHLILFGDFKQLPPATSKPPFIALPRVHGGAFDFRVLRQNRRVISDVARREEIENFHGILHDVAHGISSDRVRTFLVQAYVRGAQRGCAADAPFEGVTSVFAKRRYRDTYNRTIVKRIGKTHNHTLKVKARVRARGQRGGGFYGEKKVAYLRRKCKTQNLWLLQLAGDFHTSYETEEVVDPTKQHMMRAMLSTNLAVDSRFANGTQGRVMMFHPKSTKDKHTALSAGHSGLMTRFLKETSLRKDELFPDIDHIDVQSRPEGLNARGEPIMLQLSLVPAYALTIHKTQALSIKHVVCGCLEGIFAWGQLYVLISRVTDPANLHLIGLPPKDLVEEVGSALKRAGYSDIDAFIRWTDVSREWEYKASSKSFAQKYIRERQVPMTHKTLEEILNPQPVAGRVLLKLLDYIDRVDRASKDGSPRPKFLGDDREPIFPPSGHPDELWWLTELSRRKTEERMARDELLEEGADESDNEEVSEDDIVKDKKDCDDDDTDVFSEDESDPSDTLLSASSSSNAGQPRLPLTSGPHESQSSFRRGASSAILSGSQTSES